MEKKTNVRGYIYNIIIANHGFESASFLSKKEEIDENHTWVTDDDII